MRASRWDLKPAGRVKAKRVGSVQSCTGQRTTATPRLASADEAQAERSCWDPKEGHQGV